MTKFYFIYIFDIESRCWYTSDDEREGGHGGRLLLFHDAVANQFECYALTNIIGVSLHFTTYGVVVSLQNVIFYIIIIRVA